MSEIKDPNVYVEETEEQLVKEAIEELSNGKGEE